MIDLNLIYNWLKKRKVRRDKEAALKGLLELNSLTVTIHGRIHLAKVVVDPDNGIPDEVKRIYSILLSTAPVAEFAGRN